MKTFKHVKTLLWLNKYDGLKLLWSCKRLVACQCLPEVNRMYPVNWKRRKRLYKMSDMNIIIISLRNGMCRTYVCISGIRLFSYDPYIVLLLIKYNFVDRPYPACFILLFNIHFLLRISLFCQGFLFLQPLAYRNFIWKTNIFQIIIPVL